MDNRTPELIEAEMARTRQSLSAKVSALEDTVVGTVQSASSAVKDTVTTVRTAVEESVDAVRDRVTSVLDVSGHVREHPWAMVGGAAAAGFLVGCLVPRTAAPAGAYDSAPPAPSGPRSTGSTRGMWDTLLDRITAELRKVGESAVENLSTVAQRAMSEKLPKVVDRLLEPSPARAETEPYPIGRWNGAAAG